MHDILRIMSLQQGVLPRQGESSMKYWSHPNSSMVRMMTCIPTAIEYIKYLGGYAKREGMEDRIDNNVRTLLALRSPEEIILPGNIVVPTQSQGTLQLAAMQVPVLGVIAERTIPLANY